MVCIPVPEKECSLNDGGRPNGHFTLIAPIMTRGLRIARSPSQSASASFFSSDNIYNKKNNNSETLVVKEARKKVCRTNGNMTID
jgi:hypothetical protein